MLVSKFKRIALAGTMLTVVSVTSGCSGIDRLSQIGEQPKLSSIENPTTQPGYKPVQMPMPKPETVSYNPNSLWRNGSRSFFKDQRAHQIGDLLTVTVNITDQANFANETQRSRTATEDSGITAFLGSSLFGQRAQSVLPGRFLTADSDHGNRRQGYDRAAGNLTDQRRRDRHPGVAERQSRGRGQAGDPRQLREARTDRRRHRAAGGYPERQHHRLLRRSRRPASPMAVTARSATSSNRATAARSWTCCCRSRHNELPHRIANLGAVRCSTRPSSAPLTEAAIVLSPQRMPAQKKTDRQRGGPLVEMFAERLRLQATDAMLSGSASSGNKRSRPLKSYCSSPACSFALLPSRLAASSSPYMNARKAYRLPLVTGVT